MAPEQRNGGGLLMDCLIALGGSRGFGVPGNPILRFSMLCMTAIINLP